MSHMMLVFSEKTLFKIFKLKINHDIKYMLRNENVNS